MVKQDYMWEPLETTVDSREKIWSKNRTFAQDVWWRFCKKKTALAGLVVIALTLLFALCGPMLTEHDYRTQNLDFVNLPPFFHTYSLDSENNLYITSNLKAVVVDSNGSLLGSLKRIKDDPKKKLITFRYDEGTIAVDYSQKPAAMLNKAGERVIQTNFQWNKTYLLGADSLGRDLLARLMYGTRISLLVAFIATSVNLVIGVLYGGVSAYCGGNIDSIMMRIVDVISTIPLTLYVILIMVVLDSGLLSIIVALGTVYWVDMARLVRGQILSLKEQEFVYAAKTIGSSPWYILTRHLIPNAMGPILVTLTMLIPSAIFMEAFMSFIGLGVAAPMASLGTMCNDAIETLRVAPYQMLMPALAICIAMFAFNFVGDGIRDALDPKLKK